MLHVAVFSCLVFVPLCQVLWGMAYSRMNGGMEPSFVGEWEYDAGMAIELVAI